MERLQKIENVSLTEKIDYRLCGYHCTILRNGCFEGAASNVYLNHPVKSIREPADMVKEMLRDVRGLFDEVEK